MLELCLRAPASCWEETSIDEFFQCNGDRDARVVRRLRFDFLEEFDSVRPLRRGAEHRSSPPALFRAFLHCYYKERLPASSSRAELQNTVTSGSAVASIDRRRGNAVDRFPHRPRTRRRRGLRPLRRSRPPAAPLLGYSIDSRRRDDARRPRRVEGYDQPPKSTTTATAVRSSRPGKDPDCRGVHRASKRQRRRRCARCDALSPSSGSGCFGDSAYDTLGWHDHLLAAGGRASHLNHNARNTDDPKDIEYRGRSPHRRTQRGRSAGSNRR